MINATDTFHELASSSVRPLDWDVAISFTKERNASVSWFALDLSALDGGDLLASDIDSPIQLWDSYDYKYLKERLVDMTISRSVAFPYNVQSSVADFTLDNHDKMLTFSENGTASPIGEYILPKRPCRLYLGFKGGGVLPMFVGLTQGLPSYNGRKDEKAVFTAMDFLSEIGDMSLNNMLMMRDARTDEVIAAILTQFGVGPEMYNLDHGLNTIPFVFFESGKNAGNALRELVQAENGALWLDEQGIIRFQPRTGVVGKTAVMLFDENNVISVTPSRTDGIVNKVSITSDVRAVQEKQPIFSMENENGYSAAASDDSYRIGVNRSIDVWLSLEDPAWSATIPAQNGSNTDSNFVAVDLTGKVVEGGVTATGTLLADSYKLTLTNTNSTPVSISYLELWGEPAKVIDEIKYRAYDSESVEKYGNMELELSNNNCFGSYKNVDSFASDILAKYAQYSPTIEMSIKGNPALQLQDIVASEVPGYEGDYQIISVKQKLANSKLEMVVTLRKIVIMMPFVLDQSVLDGADVLT